MPFKNAKWVTSKNCDSPIIVGKFNANKETVSADITICGLGFFELFINGKKVSDDILVPAYTDYEPREGRQLLYPNERHGTYRTLYKVYDILPFITEGENLIEVWLGNGWYNQTERVIEGEMWYDFIKLIYAIKLTENQGKETVFVSDENLKWKKSPIVFNNIFFGEKWDFENLHDTLYPVEIAAAPKSDYFEEEICPADKEISVIEPKEIFSDGTRRVFDAGVNISGYAKVKGRGKIKITYSENLNEDNTLNYGTTGAVQLSVSGVPQIQTDEYNTDKERILKPKFSVKAFRYIEVSGDISEIQIVVVHSDIKVSSNFESDNEILNWLYSAHIRTELNNLHYGVVTDCPHRERLGYTGDGQVTCNALMQTLDSKLFYCKWIRDIYDCQNKITGNVENTAPFGGGGGGPGGWGGAIVIIPYNYYKHFGDKEILREGLPYMLKWYEFMLSRAENNLISKKVEGCWFLGEWCTPARCEISPALVNTYYFITCMRKVLEIANILGEEIDKDGITQNIDKCLAALKENFGDISVENDQGAACFLADLGLYDIDKIAEKYRSNPVFDTGIFGTPLLLKLLFENGYEDTAFELLANPDDVNFNYMKNRGATTFWEAWRGGSHDHPMFSSVVENIFEHIMGIGQEDFGFENIVIAPKIPQKLGSFSGYMDTKAGRISVSFDRKTGEYTVTVPKIAKLILNGKETELSKGDNKITHK